MEASAVAAAAGPVFVIDDDALVRTLLGDMLQKAAVPFTAFQTAEAAEAGLSARPSMALLDLNLPGKAGDAFCQNLRLDDRYWDLPVVMMTSAEKREAVGRCFLAGADDYLLKPLEERQVLSKVWAVRSSSGPAEPVAHTSRGKRVLVASAKSFFGTMVKRLLEKSGYEVGLTTTLEKAQEVLAGWGPTALAIVDVELPEAAVLVAKLRVADALLPVVAVGNRIASLSLTKSLSDLEPYDIEGEFEHLVRRVNKLLLGSTRSDRRSGPRIPFHTIVQFRLYGVDEWLLGFSFDLSETGVYVRTLTPLPSSKPVEVSFQLADGTEALTARGLVVWSNPFGPRTVFSYPYGMGITFSEFPVAEWTKLREFIQSQKS